MGQHLFFRFFFCCIHLFVFIITPSSAISLRAGRPNSYAKHAGQIRSDTPAGSNSATNKGHYKASGQFWAGADIGTLLAAETIPGRKFYDYDGKTQKDPIKSLGDAGVNAVRVSCTRGQCLGPTVFEKTGKERAQEQNYERDFGCIDIQVETAQRAIAEGMRVQLTIGQGLKIPKEFESDTYVRMLDEVKKETKRQLQPFLTAAINPDIILFENEGIDGFLFEESSTGHQRASLDSELCGLKPTGKMDSYPQYAGYLKASINACTEAITAAGLSTDPVRFGLHSHGQYVQWKESVVHGDKPGNQTTLLDSSGKPCAEQVIPTDILKQDVAQMLTIAGFSAYPDPMTPHDIDSAPSRAKTLERLNATLVQLQNYAPRFGRYDTGPFAGQYRLQALGVEYATAFKEEEVEQEHALTEMMWQMVKGFENCLGMMWWEPWYVYNNWEGGMATLARKLGEGEESGEAPTQVLRTWGAAARSPWKE